MSTITVKYSISNEDDDPQDSIAKDHEILLSGWAEFDGVGATEAICKDFFESDVDWKDQFGDDDSASVIVKIQAPDSIAGSYDVDMELIISATATKRAQS